MHIQEILNAIYANHVYEYIVVNESHKVIEFSDKVFEICSQNKNAKECDNIHLTEIVPELYGLEMVLESILKGERQAFTIPYIEKFPQKYLHIHVHPGRRKPSVDSEGRFFESLVVLFENVTDMALTQQKLIQERNEKTLLLDDISQKNAQLKRFNEQMQEMVDEEIRKNMEKQKMVELQSRHAQMGEMIGIITHQWKQPLNVISLIVNVLKLDLKKRTLSNETIEKKLDDVLRQVHYMDQTVKDFQSFFNPSKEKILFNIYESIQSILGLIDYEYSYQNISLELRGNENISAYGYPNEFNQVILTLLKNARDAFMQHPHDHMRIVIDISEENGDPLIRVEDNAGGIPEEVIDKIFDLYVTTKENGSGLGLNIAKNVIEQNMEGKIDVHNTAEGACFTIVLPKTAALGS